jgi:hypothetical protein
MDPQPSPTKNATETLDREAELIESAIRMVASGRATSITVAGLSLAAAAMALTRPMADELGITLEPVWGLDLRLTDVRVTSS